MRLLTGVMAFGWHFASCTAATPGDKKEENSAARADIGRLSLADGSLLKIGTQSGWGSEGIEADAEHCALL